MYKMLILPGCIDKLLPAEKLVHSLATNYDMPNNYIIIKLHNYSSS